jgi:hypothetical protein
MRPKVAFTDGILGNDSGPSDDGHLAHLGKAGFHHHVMQSSLDRLPLAISTLLPIRVKRPDHS